MELYFLGTNAGVPTLQRNVTSLACACLMRGERFGCLIAEKGRSIRFYVHRLN